MSSRQLSLAALTVALGTLFISAPALTAAQTGDTFDPGIFGTNLSIGLSPQYPRAGDTVRLTAEGTGLDLGNSTLVWRAGGKTIAQGVGVTSATVIAGALGTDLAVELDVTSPDGSVRSAQADIVPAEIDLLMTSDSYTPPFYRGRALPTAGTDIIVQALARLKRPDGTFVPESAITYTWKRNGQVLGALSGLGKSGAVIPVEHLFINDIITVDAASLDGAFAGEASAVMPSTNPVLDLYEDHPLYGILYHRALGPSAFVSESEMAFVAIPYFADARSPNDSGLSYTWRVNDTPISSSVASPNELTINADNSSGQAQIGLEITHASNFYMDSSGWWNVAFPSGASTHDPFSASAQ